jgi:hypothetical protein
LEEKFVSQELELDFLELLAKKGGIEQISKINSQCFKTNGNLVNQKILGSLTDKHIYGHMRNFPFKKQLPLVTSSRDYLTEAKTLRRYFHLAETKKIEVLGDKYQNENQLVDNFRFPAYLI